MLSLARSALLASAKQESIRSNKQRKLVMDDEIFVYEKGTLVEYEYILPKEYMEFQDAYEYDQELSKEKVA